MAGIKSDYDKVDVAPPPYVSTVHEHADYSAGSASGSVAVGNVRGLGAVGGGPSGARAPALQYTIVQVASPPLLTTTATTTVPISHVQETEAFFTGSVPTTDDDRKDPPEPPRARSMLEAFGNMLFPVLGLGLVFAIMYTMLSLALCIIIVGLPYARTLLRQAALCMQPYGTEMGLKTLRYRTSPQGQVLNALWAITFGVPMMIFHMVIGVVLMCTVLLFPFGVIHMRLARRIVWPVNAEEAGPGTGNALPDEPETPATVAVTSANKV